MAILASLAAALLAYAAGFHDGNRTLKPGQCAIVREGQSIPVGANVTVTAVKGQIEVRQP